MNAPVRMDAKTLHELLEENEILREAVQQYREMLCPTAIVPPRWHLSIREHQLLMAIFAASPRPVSKENLLVSMYGVLAHDFPNPKTIEVFLCKLRSKLEHARCGITIETVWGQGIRLDSENRARLQGFIDRESEPAWQPDTPLLIAAE